MMNRLIGASVLLAAAFPALGQLTPDQLYHGTDRPIPMTVKQPAGASGELTIQLLAPGTAEVKATASVAPGKVDLAALFPAIWKPEGAPSVYYAQLAAGGKKAGPAVVVQPLTTMKYARFDPREAKGWSWYEPPNVVYSGVRTYVDKYAVLETSEGPITFAMRPDQAPNTCFSFLHLVEGGFYTGVKFHRIVPVTPAGQPFVIQGGDPSGNGEGGPGFMIDLEASTLAHDFGVISMARTPDPNSGGSQFFVCLSREATAPLDGNYTAFGQAIAGAETITKIEATKLDPETGAPLEAPVIRRAYTRDAAPYGETPAPVQRAAAAPAGDSQR